MSVCKQVFSSIVVRVLLGIVGVLCLICLLFQICMIIIHYNDYPVITAHTQKTPPDGEFPAVTVCNQNAYRQGKLRNTPSVPAAFLNDGARLREHVATLPESERAALSFELRELVRKCEFAGEPCDWDNDFTRMLDPHYGTCWIFNRNAKKRQIRPGFRNGLTVVLFGYISDLSAAAESIGFRVSAQCAKSDLQSSDTVGAAVAPGTATFVKIEKKDFHRLSAPYGGTCRDQTNSISKDACTHQWAQRHVLSKCNCLHPLYPKLEASDADFCDVRHAESRDCYVSSLAEFNGNEMFDCDCLAQCKQTIYIHEVSTAVWPANTDKLDCGDGNRTQCTEEYRQNGAEVRVFYEDFDVSTYEQFAAMTLAKLFSDIGCQITVWLVFYLMWAALIIAVAACCCACTRKNKFEG